MAYAPVATANASTLTIYEGAAGFRGLGLGLIPPNPHTDLGPDPSELDSQGNAILSDEVKIGVAGIVVLGLFAVWWTTRES